MASPIFEVRGGENEAKDRNGVCIKGLYEMRREHGNRGLSVRIYGVLGLVVDEKGGRGLY